MGKPKVMKFKDGSIVRQKEGSEWGSILLEQETFSVADNGAINKNRRVATMFAKADDLRGLGLKAGDDIGAKLGTEVGIYKEETSSPQYEGHQPKINPQTDEVITDDSGNPIYLQFHVCATSSDNAGDKLVGSESAEAESASEVEADAGDLS